MTNLIVYASLLFAADSPIWPEVHPDDFHSFDNYRPVINYYMRLSGEEWERVRCIDGRYWHWSDPRFAETIKRVQKEMADSALAWLYLDIAYGGWAMRESEVCDANDYTISYLGALRSIIGPANYYRGQMPVVRRVEVFP